MNTTRMTNANASNPKMDRDLQDKLYMNIALLNMIHEPSADFRTVFKRDMFAKSNKSAFFHVVHYLLTVLNPEMAKEKLVTWPTCNVINRENKFRKEVLNYLNELNKLYEEADLPTMMSSHLLAPGGYRFIHFMYKLSQLVLFEDLKRDYPFELLCRPKQSSNEEINEKAYQNIMTYTNEINTETNNAINKFNRMFEIFKKEAEKTVKEKHEVYQQLKEIDTKIEIEERKLGENKLTKEEISKKLQDLQNKFETVEKINNIYSQCNLLVSHLKENSNEGETLDLAEALKVTNINLRRQLSELPDYEITELESYLQILEKRKEELGQVEKHLRTKHEAFVEAMSKSENLLKDIIEDVKED
ncbi:augmin complex subunit dgt6 [Coccinella septempunctata]|uniref:augmin complex subunit dgt6 n=1 Tax=Coccinella septempunctata TaxID=41139 RepID=UPI001D0908E8|nr:augmin complex subunit dgt6 [Coccinella septempunctata]